jgi:hypothetical protein
MRYRAKKDEEKAIECFVLANKLEEACQAASEYLRNKIT